MNQGVAEGLKFLPGLDDVDNKIYLTEICFTFPSFQTDNIDKDMTLNEFYYFYKHSAWPLVWNYAIFTHL